jgi:1-aminocyclopropane-1-carboxylate deaminase/D-cysteine desulfhydrase-like pyridoxal-dependent ACC family enzyme
MAIEAARLTGHEIVVRPAEVAVLGGFIGAGYGIPTPEGLDAIRLVAHMEGVFLDPTYTGKAMAGLIAEIRAGRFGQDETIVFLHTGGEPGLFAHPEIAHLPRG